MQHKSFIKLLFTFAGLTSGIFAIITLSGTAYALPTTCTWTGSGDGVSWNEASNWSCTTGTIPANGDNLVFNQSILLNFATLDNNITGLQLNNISFTGSFGSTGYNYNISGSSISLSDGVTDTSSGANDLNLGINLTANQSFTEDAPDTFEAINLGTNNLTVSGNADFNLDGLISGSGALNIDSPDVTFIDANNTSLTGPININEGRAIINVSAPSSLGTGAVTIANGATLQDSINSTGTYTLTNPFILGGSGNGASGQLDVDLFGGGLSTVDFTGNFTLTANSQVSLESANANIEGSVSGCNYAFSEVVGSSGTLGGNLTGSCPSNNSSNNSTTSSSDPSTAKTPDTGYGTPAQPNSITAIIITIGAICSTGVGLLLRYRQRA
jgi:hypothetical protein